MSKAKNLLMALFFALPIGAFCQCDSSSGEYAQVGSYEIFINPEKAEKSTPPSQLANCTHLLQIEAARKDDVDVVLEIDNYIIVVTSRENLQQHQIENQAK
ncbi:MAG: hypothetical protein Crog4KO_32390 [Crocinitomicaceae bacterium]